MRVARLARGFGAVLLSGLLAGPGLCGLLPLPLSRTLRSGDARLAVYGISPGHFGIRLSLPTPGSGAPRLVALQAAPMNVELVAADGSAAWLTGAYSVVTPSRSGVLCLGAISTSHGTRFLFRDLYSALGGTGAFRLDRQVSVLTPGAQDIGFSTRFALYRPTTGSLADFDYFAPGVWYRDNRNVPPTALASDLNGRFYYIREDRLPLPLIMMRDRRDGVALSLAHRNPDGGTFFGEDGLNRIVDARMQFGSLGVYRADRPVLAFLYPGSEGDKTYVFGGSTERRWALRSHPVQTGVRHAYSLIIRPAQTSDFPGALRDAWKATFEQFHPPVYRTDIEKIYRDSISLLSAYCKAYNGVMGLPFAVRVPDGTVRDVSFQMGFIGQQIPAGYHLIRYGLSTGDAGMVSRGEAIVDFWSRESLTPEGLPRTWYDVEGTVGWRRYNTFLRVASDGMDGALQAWDAMNRNGRPHPAWLAFCRRFGDWLIAHQNADASFYRQWDFASNPVETTKYNTTHPIPFLVRLARLTGDGKYRQAALRAGEYCWTGVHLSYAYVGGTPDNPDVMDKEAGLKALDAFLALHEMTGERRWLDAAIQAAWFSETWLVCWNVPMPAGDPGCDFPKGRTTYGLSLIATGHSGADTFLAGYVYQYYRLYRLTGERHFLDVARILLHDTKQLMDWDGTLGYAHPGLQTEALSLSLLRGHSVRVWLPWLTVSAIEPLTRLRDEYGAMDIDRIESLRAASARPSPQVRRSPQVGPSPQVRPSSQAWCCRMCAGVQYN